MLKISITKNEEDKYLIKSNSTIKSDLCFNEEDLINTLKEIIRGFKKC